MTDKVKTTPADSPDAERVGGLVEVAFKKADEIFHGNVDQLHKFNRFQLANYILWGMNYISSRLAEAEKVIDHYGDEKTFEYVDDITEPLNVFCIYKGELENIEYTTGQHVAREYRAKYPKGENL